MLFLLVFVLFVILILKQVPDSPGEYACWFDFVAVNASCQIFAFFSSSAALSLLEISSQAAVRETGRVLVLKRFGDLQQVLSNEVVLEHNKKRAKDNLPQHGVYAANEVQVLIDNYQTRFILTGSSARKLKRGGANLLGGRAVVRYLFPSPPTNWAILLIWKRHCASRQRPIISSPHNCSVISVTRLVDTPLTYISAMASFSKAA